MEHRIAIERFANENPFIKVVPPLAVGIFCAYRFDLAVWVCALGFSCLSAGYLVVARRGRRTLSACVLLGCVAALGCLLCALVNPKNDAKSLYHFVPNNSVPFARVIVIDKPVERKHSFRARVQVTHILDSAMHANPVSGQMYVYIPKTSDEWQKLSVGSVVVLPTDRWERIVNFTYPSVFDYEAFALRRNIFFRYSLRAAERLNVVDSVPPNRFTHTIVQVRQWIFSVVDTVFKDRTAAAFAKALVVGERVSLDENLQTSYRVAGIVHVIAISGMHVGLIFLLLAFAFSGFGISRYAVTIRSVLLIIITAFYGFLTVGGPSISRSIFMFLCICLAMLMRKRVSFYNNLCLSAFILLCVQPFALFDLGFLLSYTAVLGIALFQAPILSLFPVKGKISVFFAKIMSVTLAAQVLSTPVLLIFFAHFSTYFLLTNIIAIPLVNGILPLCLISILTHPILPIFSVFIAKIATTLLTILNFVVEKVAHLPYAYVSIHLFSVGQMIFYFMICFCVLIWWHTRKNILWTYSLCALIGMQICMIAVRWQVRSQEKLFIHPDMFVEKIQADRSYFFCLDTTFSQERFTEKQQATKQANRVTQVKLVDFSPAYFLQNERVFCWNTRLAPQVVLPDQIDVLVLSAVDSFSFARIQNHFPKKAFILFKNVYDQHLREKIILLCQKRNVSFTNRGRFIEL